MDSATQDLLYQRIDELVYDEEKIVTCASLASELNISFSETKNILTTYLKDYGKLKQDELSVTYLLCGILKDDKGVAVYLVKDDDIHKKKCFFDTISAELIYSIQRGKQIDFNMIALRDSTCETNLGCIVSKNSIKRVIKKKNPAIESTANVKENGSFFNKHQQTLANAKSGTSSQDQSKEQTASQKCTKSKQSGGIASFFSKAPVNKSVKLQSQDKVKTENAVNNVQTPAQNDSCVYKQKLEIENLCNEKMDTESTDQQLTKEESVTQTNKKKRKKERKNGAPNKKRKRIQDICDSDSSDIFDDEPEDIIDKSDEECAHVPVIVDEPLPKNKKRKAVDKTYVDEEGFIVTATEYIYEDASEDEKDASVKLEEKPTVLLEKKNAKISSPAETKPSVNKRKLNKKPAIGKQATLMSFFKKS
ncbi:DNA polymerase delta subunit 3-like [Tenebrio molitor]|uniref:DNA polymerase delta subunit 3-like n=1 Tax=Tenebrio molitor TaxID=7067 RepID=UPI003624AAA4